MAPRLAATDQIYGQEDFPLGTVSQGTDTHDTLALLVGNLVHGLRSARCRMLIRHPLALECAVWDDGSETAYLLVLHCKG